MAGPRAVRPAKARGAGGLIVTCSPGQRMSCCLTGFNSTVHSCTTGTDIPRLRVPACATVVSAVQALQALAPQSGKVTAPRALLLCLPAHCTYRSGHWWCHLYGREGCARLEAVLLTAVL